MMAKANGGEFPFWRVFNIVAGDTPVTGHDTTQMPLYSQRMRSQELGSGFRRLTCAFSCSPITSRAFNRSEALTPVWLLSSLTA